MNIPVNYQHPENMKLDEHREDLGDMSVSQLGLHPSYLFSPYFCFAYRAAMATLLNTQKPLAALRMLWCPGGLSTMANRSHISHMSYFSLDTK